MNVTTNKNITVKNKRKIQQIKKEENIEKNMHDTLNYQLRADKTEKRLAAVKIFITVFNFIILDLCYSFQVNLIVYGS